MIKIYLEPDGQYRNGYINITSRPTDVATHEGMTVIPGRFDNLDPLVGNNSVDEIVFGQPLNIIDPNGIVKVLKHWSDKLAPLGELRVFGVDARVVGKMAADNEIALSDIHALTLGDKFRFSCILDTNTLIEAVKSIGLRVNSVVIDNYLIQIEASKDGANSNAV